MTDQTLKTIDLIRKLLAKSESAAQLGSAEEAAAFAAKASELLLRHKLDMTDLEVSTEEADEPVGRHSFDPSETMRWVSKGRRVAWLQALVSGIARANFCRILVIPGSKTVVVIGRPSDAAIVKYLTHVLVREAERLAVLYERQVRVGAERAGLPRPVEPKKGFLLGFVDAVLKRLREMRASVEKAGGKHALVRFQAAELAVTKWMEQRKFSAVGGLNHGGGNAHAWEAGRQAGSKVNLNPGLGGGPVSKQPTIAKGQNLLGGGK